MPKFNTTFELTINDIDLIESALQYRKKELSLQRLALLAKDDKSDDDPASLEALNQTLAETHDLLGRLHNQKIFYRPEEAKGEAPYVSG
jgi:hypothetical protein